MEWKPKYSSGRAKQTLLSLLFILVFGEANGQMDCEGAELNDIYFQVSMKYDFLKWDF